MKWKPGQSGNPDGRPKGVPDKRTKLRALLDPHAEELIAKAVEKALAGEDAALRLCIERLIPPYKGVSPAVILEAMKDAEGLTTKAQVVVDAIAGGEINPADGGAFIGALSQLAKISEFENLEQRITALEKHHAR